MVSTPTDLISAFLFGFQDRPTYSRVSDAREARLRMRQYHIRYSYAFFLKEYLTGSGWEDWGGVCYPMKLPTLARKLATGS